MCWMMFTTPSCLRHNFVPMIYLGHDTGYTRRLSIAHVTRYCMYLCLRQCLTWWHVWWHECVCMFSMATVCIVWMFIPLFWNCFGIFWLFSPFSQPLRTVTRRERPLSPSPPDLEYAPTCSTVSILTLHDPDGVGRPPVTPLTCQSSPGPLPRHLSAPPSGGASLPAGSTRSVPCARCHRPTVPVLADRQRRWVRQRHTSHTSPPSSHSGSAPAISESTGYLLGRPVTRDITVVAVNPTLSAGWPHRPPSPTYIFRRMTSSLYPGVRRRYTYHRRYRPGRPWHHMRCPADSGLTSSSSSVVDIISNDQRPWCDHLERHHPLAGGVVRPSSWPAFGAASGLVCCYWPCLLLVRLLASACWGREDMW